MGELQVSGKTFSFPGCLAEKGEADEVGPDRSHNDVLAGDEIEGRVRRNVRVDRDPTGQERATGDGSWRNAVTPGELSWFA